MPAEVHEEPGIRTISVSLNFNASNGESVYLTIDSYNQNIWLSVNNTKVTVIHAAKFADALMRIRESANAA